MAARAIPRDDDAIRRLLLSCVGDAQRLATWILHDATAAEDAVQEAALLAWERRRDLRDPTTADAWFNRILVNVCRRELRRRARHKPVVGWTAGGDATASSDPGAGDWARPAGDRTVADRLADRDELARAIVRLDPDEQILLALRYGRDLTVRKIAETTGLREGTVKSRLHYALDHLRSALEAERRAEEARE